MDYLNNAKMRPFDTIIVYQTTGNKILSRSSLIDSTTTAKFNLYH